MIDVGNYMSSPKQPYSVDDSTGYLINRLSREMQRYFEALLDETGAKVTPQMWLILSTIGHHNVTIPSQISDRTGVDRTATARSLTKMSKEKLITRKPSPNDGRSSQVILTKKGEKALQTAAHCSQKTNEYFLGKISNKEHEALKKIIPKLLSGERGGLVGFD